MAGGLAEKCARCPGSICCTYVTQHLRTPRSKADFGHLLWQVSHRSVEVYKDQGGWYLLVHSPCEHLDPAGRCAIYAQRPSVCRDYDNLYCEYDDRAENGFLLYFRGYQQLLTYCKKRFRTWGR